MTAAGAAGALPDGFCFADHVVPPSSTVQGGCFSTLPSIGILRTRFPAAVAFLSRREPRSSSIAAWIDLRVQTLAQTSDILRVIDCEVPSAPASRAQDRRG